MVAKINNGSSLFGALSYNQQKVDQGKGKILFSNPIGRKAEREPEVGNSQPDKRIGTTQ